MTKDINNFPGTYPPVRAHQGAGIASQRMSNLESTIKDYGESLLSHSPAIGRNNSPSSTPTSQKIEVLKIQFTQVSVSPNFTDGRKVADLAQQLASGTISPDDISPIRVVQYHGRIWTLDNPQITCL